MDETKCQKDGHVILKNRTSITCIYCDIKYECKTCERYIERNYNRSPRRMNYVPEECIDCKIKIEKLACKKCNLTSCACGCSRGCVCPKVCVC